MTGWKINLAQLDGKEVWHYAQRKARGRKGHLGPDKARKPNRSKPPWRTHSEESI